MGVFANALNAALERSDATSGGETSRIAAQERPGLVAWLVARFRRRVMNKPRLTLVERITIAPRQTIALVEADGQRLLVATSSDGAPLFFPLKAAAPPSSGMRLPQADGEGAVS